MKKFLHSFLLSLLAGIGIGIGGTVYLSLENKIIGSVLFTVGLYIICLQGLYLYTGKIGYLLDQPKKAPYALTLASTWLGNLAGTYLTAKAVSLTRFAAIGEAARTAASAKINDGIFSLLLLGFFCGILVYAAVDGFKKTGNPVILFLCVTVFILCGFEHCIANMFYITMAGMWSGKALLSVLVVTLGNSLGGLLIPGVQRLVASSRDFS